jgi:hypothetical protein
MLLLINRIDSQTNKNIISYHGIITKAIKIEISDNMVLFLNLTKLFNITKKQTTLEG